MSRRIVLVRHPKVADEYRGVCYGQSDVPLGPNSRHEIASIVAHLIGEGPFTQVVHSGAIRCAALAEAIAASFGVVSEIDLRLRERSFGEWELQPWHDLYAATGDAMLGMLTAPATWRPRGGETTFEMRDRVFDWYRNLPISGSIVAITHGGPIAALRGTLDEVPVADWPSLIPECGSIVRIVE